MRATLILILMLSCLISPVRGQVPVDLGSPEAAFAGSAIKLSKNAAGLLRSHYQGDKVPIIPQPFRGKLDTALMGRDWQRVDVEKKSLETARGVVAVLAWEQSRFIATGSIGIAELHALDVAATGSTGLSETAVMLWFYAAAVTMTDGHKCADPAAKEAHLDKLRGYQFEPVNRLIRTISEDRLGAMRDLAIRLETVLSVDRTDDTMCRSEAGKADVKPDASWRQEAVSTRKMLPKHLLALGVVMRPRPIAKPEPSKPEASKPAVATPPPVASSAPADPPAAAKPDTAHTEPVNGAPAKAEPAAPAPETKP